MKSSAKTVDEYLASLPVDRRDALKNIRQAILNILPKGIVETMNWGMISYEVPLKVFPNTHNQQPLMFVALASQKNHMAIYQMITYGEQSKEDWLRNKYEIAGKKLDMGKGCIRFKKLSDLWLDPILELISKSNLEGYIKRYEHAQADRKRANSRRKSS